MSVDLDVVLPVHDEELTLERSVRRLDAHLASWPSWRITIVDCEHDPPAWRVSATTLVGCQQVAA